MNSILGGNIGKISAFNKKIEYSINITEGGNKVSLYCFKKGNAVTISGTLRSGCDLLTRISVPIDIIPHCFTTGSFACNSTTSDNSKLSGFVVNTDGIGYIWITYELVGTCYIYMSYIV